MKIKSLICALLFVFCFLSCSQSAYASDSSEIVMTREQFLELKQLSTAQEAQLTQLEAKLNQLNQLSQTQKSQLNTAQNSLQNVNDSLTTAEAQLTESQEYLNQLKKQMKAEKDSKNKYKILCAVLAIALCIK